MHDKTIKTIGLTGGIGSGKTVATTALRENGYTVIDADEVSRTLFARGSAGETALMSIFPAAVDNGRLDRGKLRRIIANDLAEREKLNAATHPTILSEIKRLLSDATTPVILSAPLLFESGLDALCDAVICVHCPPQLQAQRIRTRDGIDESTAQALIAAQMRDEERRQKSDYTVSSDTTVNEFVDNVLSLVSRITKANG